MRSRLTPVLALLATALTFGLVGLTPPAQAAPLAPITGTVEIKTDSFQVGGNWRLTAMTVNPSTARAISYQWLREGEEIEGATSELYRATPADLGYSLSLEIEVAAEGYETSFIESPETDPIERPGTGGSGSTSSSDDDDDELDYFDAYKPLITGAARVGQTVKVETDPDDYDETTTLVYQWLIGSKPAKKGTGTSFKIKKKHRGLALSVQVTASAPGYETETVTSRRLKIKR